MTRTFPLGVLALLSFAGCSVAGGAPGPVPSPPSEYQGEGTGNPDPTHRPGEGPATPPVDPPSRGNSKAHPTALAVVETAYEAIGTPYLWGGNGRNGFDCSGLIRYAYGEFGIRLPRISRDQLGEGDPVELRIESLRPGDILGFSAVVGGQATHVGLYVGDGEFIHSSTSGVRISDLRTPYWQQHFIAARRMVR